MSMNSLYVLFTNTKNMIIFKVCLHIEECKETKFVSVNDLYIQLSLNET